MTKKYISRIFQLLKVGQQIALVANDKTMQNKTVSRSNVSLSSKTSANCYKKSRQKKNCVRVRPSLIVLYYKILSSSEQGAPRATQRKIIKILQYYWKNGPIWVDSSKHFFNGQDNSIFLCSEYKCVFLERYRYILMYIHWQLMPKIIFMFVSDLGLSDIKDE